MSRFTASLQQRVDRALKRQVEEIARGRELDQRIELAQESLESFGVTNFGPELGSLDITVVVSDKSSRYDAWIKAQDQARSDAEAAEAAQAKDQADAKQDVTMGDAGEDSANARVPDGGAVGTEEEIVGGNARRDSASARGSEGTAIDDDTDMDGGQETANEDGAPAPDSGSVSGAQGSQGEHRKAQTKATGAPAPVSSAETTARVSAEQGQAAVPASGTRDGEFCRLRQTCRCRELRLPRRRKAQWVWHRSRSRGVASATGSKAAAQKTAVGCMYGAENLSRRRCSGRPRFRAICRRILRRCWRTEGTCEVQTFRFRLMLGLRGFPNFAGHATKFRNAAENFVLPALH
jgi:hypothetical protein